MNEYLLCEEKAMSIHFRYLLRCEESYLKQKSRVNWLKLGDANTKYFHNSIKQRNSMNNVPVLKLENGNYVHTPKDIHKEMTNFYTKLFNDTDEGMKHIDYSIINADSKLPSEDSDSLVKEVMEAEVKQAVFSIGSDKAAGPDGYNSFFYKNTWDIISLDLTKAVREAFTNGKILNSINSTTLAVIPKSLNDESLNDFRPIACCRLGLLGVFLKLTLGKPMILFLEILWRKCLLASIFLMSSSS
ncbi:uncharacterized protein LOC126656850 [Mercurialis annua]|uniref:uncharacterized protein LOC126656850 n=1 Tax=Mercurialis annua TaxID=3986 RepID=UPI002160388C|nr:uncharacterized protein LOC126656850 [Mercurialis annua]